ncbi:hypothetical protein [Novosphingobium sp. G106]|uniref:hypothetical protein n=1 Tax=Novosphingobium sp. G106 TaxID=2849500 RepID=UPI0020C2CF79|nr:hypothetical protein [Novosphingobium sp. G106]
MPSEALRWHDVRKTSGFRLTLLLGSIATAGLLLLLLLIFILIARDLTHRSDRVLRSEAARLEAVSPDQLSAEVTRYILSSASGLNYVGLVRPDGRAVSGNLRLAGSYPLETPFEVDSLKGISHPLRVLAHRTATGRLLLIGRDIAPLADLRRQIGRILILSALLVLPLLLAAGVIVSIGPPATRQRSPARGADDRRGGTRCPHADQGQGR